MSAGIRAALADSVEAVLRAMAEADADVSLAGPFAEWRRALTANPRPSPLLWAVYHDLVEAALAQRPDRATQLAADLLGRSSSAVAAAGVVATFTPEHLGGDVARCLALLDHNTSLPLGLRAVEPQEVRRVAHLLVGTRERLALAAPDLLHEVDVLGHLLLLGQGDKAVFGGAATVFLWGAVVLNPSRIEDWIDLAESLAHETAHALLFGLTVGRDLTTNDPDERYSSPLRRDARPMEGIVHATYVLARMVHALQALARAGGLDEAERRRVADKIGRNVALYRSGLETVTAHARFTAEGEQIFTGCRQAMAAALRAGTPA